MSNFALRPIDIEIRKKLLQKQRAFSRKSAGINAAGASVTDPDMVQFFNRTTWAHLISLSVIKSTDGNSRLAIIGAGEFNQEPEVANQPLMKSSFEDIYRPKKDGKSTLLKPISGIKSISTKFEGTLKSRRDATVQFTIFSLEDLERLSPHFLRVGGEVLLEFGWNSKKTGLGYDFSNTLGSQIITAYHDKGLSSITNISSIDQLKTNSAENYEKAVLDLKGDYEYMLGTIKNFDYSLRSDGGFDCTIVITTIGMSLLDNKVNREESPSQILQHELNVEDEKVTDVPHTTFYHVIDNLPEILTYSIINNYVSDMPGEEDNEDKEEDLPNNPPMNKISAFSDWYLATFDTTKEEELEKAKKELGKVLDTFKDIAQKLSLPQWMEFKYVDTGEIYYYNYYKNEVSISKEGLETPESVKQFTVTSQADIEEMLSIVDGGKYVPFATEYYDQYGNITSIYRGIHDFLNTTDGDFDAELKNYFEDCVIIWETRKPGIEKYGGIIEVLKKTSQRKKEIFNEIDPNSVPDIRQMTIIDYGPIDFRRSAETLVKMRTGDISGYKNTSMTDGYQPIATDQYSWSPTLQTLPINLSMDPVTDHKYNEVVGGNSSIFQDIYDRGLEMKKQLEEVASGGEMEQKPFTYVETEETWKHKDFEKTTTTEIKTTFVAYTQQNTIQALTGFNWDGGEFVPLAKDFCKEMFTGKELEKDIIEKMGKGVFDTTEEFGIGDEDPKKDTFLEGFLDGNLPKTWVRWGWFEDNILSKYLGFESLDTEPDEDNISPIGKPVSVFKSVEPKVNRSTDDGKIIPGYESNKIALPTNLKTTNVKEVIIPDRCATLKLLRDLTNLTGGQFYNAQLYGMLGTILENGIGNSRVAPMEVGKFKNTTDEEDFQEWLDGDSGTENSKPESRMGYIRNLLVEVTVLREAFLNIGSLREGIDNFFHILRRNFGPIHDFEIQAGKDEGMVGIVDNNLLFDLGLFKKPEITTDKTSIQDIATNMKVYEFPAWEKESIVKSQDLKIIIPDSMAITALYAGNEHKANQFNTDKSIGSLKVQKLAKFLKLDETGKDPRDASMSLGSKLNLRPLFESKNLVDSGTGESEQGMITYKYSGDFYSRLSNVYKTILATTGVDEPSYDAYEPVKTTEEQGGGKSRKSVITNIWEVNQDTSWYNPTGELGNPLIHGEYTVNFRKRMEYELEFDPRTQVSQNFNALNGLMSLGLTIDGTAGIFPGNSYISKYLPKAFEKRTGGTAIGEYPILFQSTNIEHEVTPSGWNTTITGMPRLNNKAFPTYHARVSEDEDKTTPSEVDSEVTDGLSRYLNFFNLNHVFANSSLKNIIGINPVIGIDDDEHLFNKMMAGINLPENHANYDYKDDLVKKVEWNDYKNKLVQFMDTKKSANPGYANYEDFYNALSDTKTATLRVIPEKLGDYPRAKPGTNDKVAGTSEVTYNPLQMLLFLQISSVITGITYIGMTGGSRHGFRRTAPLTVSRVFYTHALADMVDWKSSRPEGLVGKNNMMKQIGEDNSNADGWEIDQNDDVYKYFGIGVQSSGTASGTIWNQQIWPDGPLVGDNFSSEDLVKGLLTQAAAGVITDLDKKSDINVILESQTDPISSGDKPQTNEKYTLLGPIHAGIVNQSWFPSGFGGDQVNEVYSEFTIAFWNLMFAVILQNELGIPHNKGVPNWAALDAKLLDLWIDSEKNHPKDALLKVDKNYVENIKSKEIFEHVLECQYLINNPGS